MAKARAATHVGVAVVDRVGCEGGNLGVSVAVKRAVCPALAVRAGFFGGVVGGQFKHLG